MVFKSIIKQIPLGTSQETEQKGNYPLKCCMFLWNLSHRVVESYPVPSPCAHDPDKSIFTLFPVPTLRLSSTDRKGKVASAQLSSRNHRQKHFQPTPSCLSARLPQGPPMSGAGQWETRGRHSANLGYHSTLTVFQQPVLTEP